MVEKESVSESGSEGEESRRVNVTGFVELPESVVEGADDDKIEEKVREEIDADRFYIDGVDVTDV